MIREEIIADYVARGWVPFAYTSETTPPFDWQRSEVTPSTVRECSATDDPVGIVLGQPSGIIVVDIDTQHGGSLERFIERYGRDLSKTRVVATPSGGYHLYYEYPKGLDYLPKRINAGKWIDGLQGIDLLADGHHVQAPPTIRVGHPTKPDGSYKVVADHPVTPIPQRLLVDWLDSLTTKTAIEGDVVELAPEESHSWMAALHAAKVREAAESTPGERDATVYRCLCVSVRLARYLPDDVLTVEQVASEYEAAYEAEQAESILDMQGKLRRAVALADANPWVVESVTKAPLPPGIPEESRSDYEAKVLATVLNRKAREAADKLIAETHAEELELPPVVSGVDLAKRAQDQPQWVVDGLLAPGQSVLLTAQKKSGKTVTTLNLIHALTTGEPFLGEHRPARPMRVAYFDLELGSVMANSYIGQLNIPREMLFYIDLHGVGRMIDTRTDTIRNKWARRLRELEVDAIVIDPVSPILSAAGLDENATTGVRQLLDSFDALAKSAGCVCGPIVVHHAGWEKAGRARGASAFGDWPGAEWNLQMSNPEDPFSGRRFAIQSNRATGGVIHRGRSLDYDPATRRVWYGEAEQPFDPKRAAYDEFIGLVVDVITTREVMAATGIGSDHTARRWLDNDPRLVVVSEGGRGLGPRTWRRGQLDPFIE